MNIDGKTILFIGTDFFNYEHEIKRSFEKRGAIVYHFSSIRRISVFIKYLFFRSRSMMRFLQRRHLTIRINQAPENIDLIFCIKGQGIEKCHIEQLTMRYPNAEKLLYLWDSINRLENWDVLKCYFDNIATFDRKDSICYNIAFRPLFFVESSQKDGSESIVYDYSHVGTFHSDRYKVLKDLKREIIANGGTYKFVLFIEWYGYLLLRFIKKNIDKEDKDLFSFRPVSYARYMEITKASSAIVDIANPLQTGLTIRTIEALSQGKHLVTTNNDIMAYSDIDSKAYVFIDRSNVHLPKIEFVAYSALPERYCLENFVEEILAMVL